MAFCRGITPVWGFDSIICAQQGELCSPDSPFHFAQGRPRAAVPTFSSLLFDIAYRKGRGGGRILATKVTWVATRGAGERPARQPAGRLRYGRGLYPRWGATLRA